MSKPSRTCQDCVFADTCAVRYPCRHYSPTVDDDDGEELIELGREQFAYEWSMYMKESQDSDF